VLDAFEVRPRHHCLSNYTGAGYRVLGRNQGSTPLVAAEIDNFALRRWATTQKQTAKLENQAFSTTVV
jgi:hypothetical protein